MSLIKQLWIAIILLVVVAFGGSFIISMLMSKNYLEQQLQTKNIDNATALALSMSQMQKDPVTIELLLTAQFDSGHYQSIRLLDPTGKVMVERQSDDNASVVPQWFKRLVAIEVTPGFAQVQDGWKQYGKIQLTSDTRFAYEDLWHGSQKLLWLSLGISLISGFLGSLLLRKILRPLDEVVKQAEAISERRFISTPEPKTMEFKLVVKAMNQLSGRIRNILDEEALRLEKLRRTANYDQASGLMNRDYFFSRVNNFVANEETFSEGVLVVTHLTGLAKIDQMLGHAETDSLLRQLGNALEAFANDNPHCMVGRLSGTDFAVFCGTPGNSYEFASQIKKLVTKAVGLHPVYPEFPQHTVAVAGKFKKTDTTEELYTLITRVLDEVISGEGEELHVIDEEDIVNQQDSDEEEWRRLLTAALNAERLKLAHYPVLNCKGKMIHQESPARLQLREDGAWLSAGEFIYWASRLNLVAGIDKLMVKAAIDELKQGKEAIGLNISTRAICNTDFVEYVHDLLDRHSEIAGRLWLEVPEEGAFEHLKEFRAFCAQLRPLGCKIGLEHVGTYVSRLGELHDLGLDFIKIDASVIRNIDKNTGNQIFLRGLCLIAHSIGLLAIAEGVQSNEEKPACRSWVSTA